jgi:hypothetical protein
MAVMPARSRSSAVLLEPRLDGFGVGAQERDELGEQLRRIRARARCLAAGWAQEPDLVAARGPVRAEGAGERAAGDRRECRANGPALAG